ncbi:hypothetical protein OTU49_017244 [Cherax quadricarinatus]|uniref:Uncharacterized protein n=1 Tax=Cherax quadricarinatus TaxID=27406 RepID=A0AAW0Y3R9_CHEQU
MSNHHTLLIVNYVYPLLTSPGLSYSQSPPCITHYLQSPFLSLSVTLASTSHSLLTTTKSHHIHNNISTSFIMVITITMPPSSLTITSMDSSLLPITSVLTLLTTNPLLLISSLPPPASIHQAQSPQLFFLLFIKSYKC